MKVRERRTKQVEDGKKMLSQMKEKVQMLEGQIHGLNEELSVKSKKLREKIDANSLERQEPDPLGVLEEAETMMLRAQLADRAESQTEEAEHDIDRLAESNPAELERLVLSRVSPEDLQEDISRPHQSS